MATEHLPLPALSFAVPPSLSAFSVPMKEYLSSHDLHESAIATGALVFDAQGRLLLVQRAAHDSMPNRWEIPGGAVDTSDPTILHGVARELFEEASLKTTSIKQQIGKEYIFFTRRGLRVEKFTFEVDVESTQDVRLDPNEHQEYVWASEEDCRRGRVLREDEAAETEIKFTFPAQLVAVLEGFRLRTEGKSGV